MPGTAIPSAVKSCRGPRGSTFSVVPIWKSFAPYLDGSRRKGRNARKSCLRLTPNIAVFRQLAVTKPLQSCAIWGGETLGDNAWISSY
jgi:hypothetical protein